MTCIQCGKLVPNWPGWLRDPSVKVSCNTCAGEESVTVNLPEEPMSFSPSIKVDEPVLELAEAA